MQVTLYFFATWKWHISRNLWHLHLHCRFLIQLTKERIVLQFYYYWFHDNSFYVRQLC